jgi:hypothetical protein
MACATTRLPLLVEQTSPPLILMVTNTLKTQHTLNQTHTHRHTHTHFFSLTHTLSLSVCLSVSLSLSLSCLNPQTGVYADVKCSNSAWNASRTYEYADVCGRMLTYADACSLLPSTYADDCWRMLTHTTERGTHRALIWGVPRMRIGLV